MALTAVLVVMAAARPLRINLEDCRRIVRDNVPGIEDCVLTVTAEVADVSFWRLLSLQASLEPSRPGAQSSLVAALVERRIRNAQLNERLAAAAGGGTLRTMRAKLSAAVRRRLPRSLARDDLPAVNSKLNQLVQHWNAAHSAAGPSSSPRTRPRPAPAARRSGVAPSERRLLSEAGPGRGWMVSHSSGSDESDSDLSSGEAASGTPPSADLLREVLRGRTARGWKHFSRLSNSREQRLRRMKLVLAALRTLPEVRRAAGHGASQPHPTASHAPRALRRTAFPRRAGSWGRSTTAPGSARTPSHAHRAPIPAPTTRARGTSSRQSPRRSRTSRPPTHARDLPSEREAR